MEPGTFPRSPRSVLECGGTTSSDTSTLSQESTPLCAALPPHLPHRSFHRNDPTSLFNSAFPTPTSALHSPPPTLNGLPQRPPPTSSSKRHPQSGLDSLVRWTPWIRLLPPHSISQTTPPGRFIKMTLPQLPGTSILAAGRHRNGLRRDAGSYGWNDYTLPLLGERLC